MKTLAIAAGGAVMVLAGHASAVSFVYETTNVIGNHVAGDMESISTSWNPSTNQFTWSISFSDAITDGFTLAVNDGPNPKNNPGQLALIYFDASDRSDVAVSAYGYNGLNSISSWYDGNGAVAGNQAPDFIAGTEGAADSSWILGASVTDRLDGGQVMSLTIDASGIQGHTPLYPDGDGEPWTGVAFAEKIGYWFHTFTNLQTAYDSDGRLTQWGWSSQGWSDRANLQAQVIPLPPAAWAGLVGLAAATAARRRFAK